MKALIHNHGGEPCGKVALFIARTPADGEVVMVRELTLLDGTHPKLGAPIKCGACGTGVALFVGDLVEMEVGYT